MENIFNYCKSEITAYQSLPVLVSNEYEWNMFEHITYSVLYKNSKYKTGSMGDKPFKNIVAPILNLQYRAEGFDVKDIVLFVNEKTQYYKSFLVKKFHDKWARENSIDTFIDEVVESYVDFGGALVKNGNKARPEVVPLQSIAFCDQTDILSGPIAIRHQYSTSQLREMAKKGWTNIEEAILQSQSNKKTDDGRQIKTPSKYTEVYEIHGVFPKSWLGELKEGDEDNSVRQLQIITLTKDSDKEWSGTVLYKGKETDDIFKLILRDKIFGRALGKGGAEELFEPQIWINYSEIRKKELLDGASKVIFQTSDTAFKTRNKLDNLENNEILITDDGKAISQINTTPVNITLFDNAVASWGDTAKTIGAANETIMGESPSSGTPFKLQELVAAEAHSLHEYRKGKLAVFIDEIYRDWIIPYISSEISKGQEFLSKLDADELQQIADNVVLRESEKLIKEKILNGETIEPNEVESLKQRTMDSFMQGGNKKFIEILKGDMSDAPMSVEINIVGKQKYLSQMVDKLVNIVRQVIAAPQVLDDPRMAKIFNEIFEYSGLSPIDFYTPKSQTPQTPAQNTINQIIK